jgi:hypothetical protein
MKRIIYLILLLVTLTAGAIIFGFKGLLLMVFPYPSCDFKAAWGRGEEQSCDCLGFEYVVTDDLEVDGSYSSACFGVPTNRH